jgi:hypothetical protein
MPSQSRGWPFLLNRLIAVAFRCGSENAAEVALAQ